MFAAFVLVKPSTQSGEVIQPRAFQSDCGIWALDVDPTHRSGAREGTYRLFREGIGVWKAKLAFTFVSAEHANGVWIGLARPGGAPVGIFCAAIPGSVVHPSWRVGVVRSDASSWWSEPVEPLPGTTPVLRGTWDSGRVTLETSEGEFGFDLAAAAFSRPRELSAEPLTLAELLARRAPRPLPDPWDVELVSLGTRVLLDSIMLPDVAFAPDGRIGIVERTSGFLHVFDDAGRELGSGSSSETFEKDGIVAGLCVDGWGRFSYVLHGMRWSFEDSGTLALSTRTPCPDTVFSFGTGIEWRRMLSGVVRWERGAKVPILRSPLERWLDVRDLRSMPDGRLVVFEDDRDLGPLFHFFDREGARLWSLQGPEGASGDIVGDETTFLVLCRNELWVLDQEGRGALRAPLDVGWGCAGFSGDRSEILVTRFESLGERPAAKYPQRIHLDRYRRP